MDELGLDRIAVTINGSDFHQISADASMRIATLERNKRAIDCAAIIGSKLLTGPFHSALCVFTGKSSTDQEHAWARENLFVLAEYAQQYGIVLGLEYLNRFESYLVTTTDELIQLVDEINHPNCKLMFDSFHANIEEQNFSKAIQKMGDRLVHVQLSENDRGIIGRGHIDFTSILHALDQIGYKGMVSVEAFSTKLTAANIWRKMFENETSWTSITVKKWAGTTKDTTIWFDGRVTYTISGSQVFDTTKVSVSPGALYQSAITATYASKTAYRILRLRIKTKNQTQTIRPTALYLKFIKE